MTADRLNLATADDAAVLTLLELDWRASVPCEARKAKNIAMHPDPFATPPGIAIARWFDHMTCCGMPSPVAGQTQVLCETCVANWVTEYSSRCPQTGDYQRWFHVATLESLGERR